MLRAAGGGRGVSGSVKGVRRRREEGAGKVLALGVREAVVLGERFDAVDLEIWV